MWEEIVACSSQSTVAFCLPIRVGEGLFPIYWYGIIAAVGIVVGALYAQHHLELEGEDPDTVWDALLWVLPAGIVGARLWYVAQSIVGGTVQFNSVLDIVNPRQGGMNIFGGAVFGVIALILFARSRETDGWVLADGALMGLLLGQGIGRFGNLVNRELYGPPTELPWGIRIPIEFRLPEFQTLAADTRFHPTMLYEAFWLFLVFGVMYYLFRRYQKDIVRGIPAGAYFILAGIGRLIVEIWRPDQPTLSYTNITTGVATEIMSYGQLFAIMFMILGSLIVLDRTGYVSLPGTEDPATPRERTKQYQRIQDRRRRNERMREREKLRNQRRRERRERHEDPAEESS